MNPEPQRTCASCGNEFSGAMEFCPVCMLRKGLAAAVASSESSFEEAAKPTTPEPAEQRFEHYKLATGEDGKPVELGRGAMGVTYKAFDINLRCPVTLKVISERYLGDESARLRLLREARAAASVRHPNQVKDSFGRAMSTARKQKSISLEKRAEATYAEYLHQKANRPGSSGVRLSLW
jgi:hypothetical protein